MLRTLMATSEAVPLAKFGGLAEPCGALPIELNRLGHGSEIALGASGEIDKSKKFEQYPPGGEIEKQGESKSSAVSA